MTKSLENELLRLTASSKDTTFDDFRSSLEYPGDGKAKGSIHGSKISALVTDIGAAHSGGSVDMIWNCSV